MLRLPKRTEDLHFDERPVTREPSKEALVGRSIAPECGCRRVDGALDDRGRPIVERVGQHGGRLNPFEAMLIEREGPEKRRRDGKRMDRGADIVNKTGQCKLGGLNAAPDGVFSFEDGDLPTGLREDDGGCEAIRSRADDDRIRLTCHATRFSDLYSPLIANQ